MIANTFDSSVNQENLKRLENLKADSKALWGTMDASKMLAHLNVAYEMALNENTKINRGFKRFLISLLAKKAVVGDRPYPKNGRTAPDFVITGNRDFESEKTKLIANINEVFQKGTIYFEGKESQSFGKLNAKEWSNLFQKHLNHHFKQFAI